MHFCLAVFNHVCERFNPSGSNFEINTNENSIKYLQGISFSQLSLSEKTEMHNLGSATTNLVTPQSSSRDYKLMRENLNLLYTDMKKIIGTFRERA